MSFSGIKKNNKVMSIDVWQTGIPEFDKALDGIIRTNSIFILGGYEGVGKSTLAMQIAYAVVSNNKIKGLFISDEETEHSIKLRAQRINCLHEQLFFSEAKTFQDVIDLINQHNPQFIVIDSLTGLYDNTVIGLPGEKIQIETIVAKLTTLCRGNPISVLLISHTTKTGIIAGPSKPRFQVDGIFYLRRGTGKDISERFFVPYKNRFGTVINSTILCMSDVGLRLPSDVIQPSPIRQRCDIVKTVVWINTSCYPADVIAYDNYDSNDKTMFFINYTPSKYLVHLLKQFKMPCTIKLSIPTKDSTVNFAICCAVICKKYNYTLPPDICIIGEVEPNGELVCPPDLKSRINFAIDHGFNEFFVPSIVESQGEDMAHHYQVVIHSVNHINDFLQFISTKKRQ